MQVEIIRVIKEPPSDEDDPNLHEFGLIYYRFITEGEDGDLQEIAENAVWVRFSAASQIETIRFHYPEATLGPVQSFTEALILTSTYEEAETACKKIARFWSRSDFKKKRQAKNKN